MISLFGIRFGELNQDLHFKHTPEHLRLSCSVASEVPLGPHEQCPSLHSPPGLPALLLGIYTHGITPTSLCLQLSVYTDLHPYTCHTSGCPEKLALSFSISPFLSRAPQWFSAGGHSVTHSLPHTPWGHAARAGYILGCHDQV